MADNFGFARCPRLLAIALIRAGEGGASSAAKGAAIAKGPSCRQNKPTAVAMHHTAAGRKLGAIWRRTRT
jgi:hypothetical protein